jgi:hypothetical protein
MYGSIFNDEFELTAGFPGEIPPVQSRRTRCVHKKSGFNPLIEAAEKTHWFKANYPRGWSRCPRYWFQFRHLLSVRPLEILQATLQTRPSHYQTGREPSP